LWLSDHFQSLSENRVLVFLNAYENPECPHLLVLGYLVASVFFYHNEEVVSDKSDLSKMLSSLKRFLSDTEVHKL
jgi:hypothetical protein